jgi:hypothetical protein
LNITEPLDDDVMSTMTLHLADHIDRAIYQERYRDTDRLRSYLLMKRKYLYLCLSLEFETIVPDHMKGITWQWLCELCQYQEFRDVHASQKHYYAAFSLLVEEAIKGREVVGYMADTRIGGAHASIVPSPQPRRCIDRTSVFSVMKVIILTLLHRVLDEVSPKAKRQHVHFRHLSRR